MMLFHDDDPSTVNRIIFILEHVLLTRNKYSTRNSKVVQPDAYILVQAIHPEDKLKFPNIYIFHVSIILHISPAWSLKAGGNNLELVIS